jgi:hypothetical protein
VTGRRRDLFVWIVYVLAIGTFADLRVGTQSSGTGRQAQNSQGGQAIPQPGATQGAIATTEFDSTPKFGMDYFVGEWKFESTLSDSPLGSGGPVSGTETIRNVLDGRFWDIEIKGEGPGGAFGGRGVIIYQDGFSGQSFARYELTDGVAWLKTGTLGCDLGGECNMYFETPPFEHKGSVIRVRGRYYLTSPFSYRVTNEISVDKSEYKNWGTIWYMKDEKAKPRAIK